MEAFGRSITVLLSAVCCILLLFFYRTASVRWQRNETVRSMGHAYATDVVSRKMISRAGWEAFQRELKQLGDYRAELTVSERRRYEGENGRIYLFSEWLGTEKEKLLSEGSYVRVVITEENRGRAEWFLYGGGGVVLAGGRVT